MSKIRKALIYLLLITNLGVILYFWFQASPELFANVGLFARALGRLIGLMAAFFTLIQIVLIGRAPWIEKLFGLDKLTNIHRLNGYLVFFLIILHPVIIIASTAAVTKLDFFRQFGQFLETNSLILAAIATAIFIAIVFLSIYIVRSKMRYETWYYIHLLTYLAIAFAFFHQVELGTTISGSTVFQNYWYALYLFAFGNLIFSHWLTPYVNFARFHFLVTAIIPETNNVNSVIISAKNLSKWHARPGQFVTLRFLAKGFWWQSHPFSLSAIPNNNQLRITIKALGDFTSKIPNLKAGTKVIIGGPFGTFTSDKGAKKYLFIAGSVGITPIRSLIEEVAPKHDIALIYSNRNSERPIFQNELDALSKQFNFPIHYISTVETDGSTRLNSAKISNFVSDFQEREIYLCGPIPMSNSLIQILTQELKYPKRKIRFEKFAF